jgi:hypothetical protein
MPSLLRKKPSLLKASQQSQLLKPKIKKPKLLRSNPLRKSLIISGRDPNSTIDDEDLITSHRRQFRFNALWEELNEMELSDEIKFRLFLARVKALQKYDEIYGNRAT